VRKHNVLGDRKSETGSGGPSRAVALVETLEKPRQLVVVNADTRIDHLDLEQVVVFRRADSDRPAGRRELDRVLDEIDEHLLDPGIIDGRGVRRIGCVRFDGEPSGFDLVTQAIDGTLDQVSRQDCPVVERKPS